jgi:uncharacterized protein YdcH (DUF465 family)
VEEIVHGKSLARTAKSPILKLTPAHVEQLAAEHDGLSDMIAAMETMSPVFASNPKEITYTSISKVTLIII